MPISRQELPSYFGELHSLAGRWDHQLSATSYQTKHGERWMSVDNTSGIWWCPSSPYACRTVARTPAHVIRVTPITVHVDSTASPPSCTIQTWFFQGCQSWSHSIALIGQSCNVTASKHFPSAVAEKYKDHGHSRPSWLLFYFFDMVTQRQKSIGLRWYMQYNITYTNLTYTV